MRFDIYEYKIPEWAVCSIVNDDRDSLTEEDEKQLDTFLSALPRNGHWSFSDEESSFSHTPAFGLACNVLDAKYLVPIDDDRMTEILTDHLPHGSGIDCDWNIEKSGDNFICKNSWHLMNDIGMCVGFIDFTLEVNMDKTEDFKITFQTNSKGYYQINKNGLREYLNDTFHIFFSEYLKEIIV